MTRWTHENVVDTEAGRLRVLRAGPGAGRPPVLLLGGLGSLASDWDAVLDHLPAAVQVVWVQVLDRDGQGLDQPVRQHAQALATLARSLGPPPYLLAGHSLGGLYAQGFARLFPALTSGVLLVDSSVPGRAASGARGCASAGRRLRAWCRALVFGLAQATARMLLSRVRLTTLAPTVRRWLVWSQTVQGRDRLPAAAVRRTYADPATVLAVLREWALVPAVEADLHRIACRHPFPPVALSVLAGARHGRPWRLRDGRWLAAQRPLADLAPGSRYRELDNAAHLVMLDRPDAVAATLDQLRQTADRI